MAPNERLAALSAAGVSIWLDDLSRERLDQRQPPGADHRQERRRGHHQPDDLRCGAGERAGLRRAGPRAGRPRRVGRRHRPRGHRRRRPAGLRRVLRHLGAHRRGRRPGLARGQPAARARHRGDPRRGAGPVEGRRPAEPAGQDPGDPGGPAGDHPRAGRGGQRQRHADLLRRALPRRHDRLPGGPGAGRRERADPGRDHLGGQLLRLPGRHRVRQAAGEDRHRRGAGAARQGRRSRTPGWPTPRSRRPSRASGGPGSPRRAPGRSDRCGPRPG